jgi:hypothetical protein
VLTLSDFTSLADVKHHFFDLIKWKDENHGVKRELTGGDKSPLGWAMNYV